MRKPVYTTRVHQRRKSTCASVQSGQRLCCSLPGWYKRYRVVSAGLSIAQTPEDRFSRDMAHLLLLYPAIQKVAGYYVIPSEPFECPSVSTSFPDSTLSSFDRFSSDFAWTLISGRSGLGLQME